MKENKRCVCKCFVVRMNKNDEKLKKSPYLSGSFGFEPGCCSIDRSTSVRFKSPCDFQLIYGCVINCQKWHACTSN